MPRASDMAKAIQVWCPQCKAQPGEKCVSRNGTHYARGTYAGRKLGRPAARPAVVIDHERAAKIKAAGRAKARRLADPTSLPKWKKKQRLATSYPPSSGRGLLPPADARALFDSLQRLGLRDLESYYRTDHWQKLRHDWKFTSGSYRCVVCGDGYNHLHHRSYERIGDEGPDDVIPLCKECHEATHEALWARTPGVTLWNAHEHTGRPRKYD